MENKKYKQYLLYNVVYLEKKHLYFNYNRDTHIELIRSLI